MALRKANGSWTGCAIMGPHTTREVSTGGGKKVRGGVRDFRRGGKGNMGCSWPGKASARLKEEVHRSKEAHVSFQIIFGYILAFEVYICRSVFTYEL